MNLLDYFTLASPYNLTLMNDNIDIKIILDLNGKSLHWLISKELYNNYKGDILAETIIAMKDNINRPPKYPL